MGFSKKNKNYLIPEIRVSHMKSSSIQAVVTIFLRLTLKSWKNKVLRKSTFFRKYISYLPTSSFTRGKSTLLEIFLLCTQVLNLFQLITRNFGSLLMHRVWRLYIFFWIFCEGTNHSGVSPPKEALSNPRESPSLYLWRGINQEMGHTFHWWIAFSPFDRTFDRTN